MEVTRLVISGSTGAFHRQPKRVVALPSTETLNNYSISGKVLETHVPMVIESESGINFSDHEVTQLFMHAGKV